MDEIILSPIHGYIILISLTAHPDVHEVSESVSRFLLAIFMTLGPQLMGLASLIFLAKTWDFIKGGHKFYSGNFTRQALIFSALLNSVILAIIGNIYVDNLFQFRNGNYFMVLMPLWALMFYYSMCYFIGNSTYKPKWLT